MSVTALPIPPHHRTVEDVLATAGRTKMDKVIVLGETDRGLLLIHNGLNCGELLWMIEAAKHLLFQDDLPLRCEPTDIA